MNVPSTTARELLHRLGAGEAIAAVCEGVGLSRDEFDRWWQAECKQRVPENTGHCKGPVRRAVRVDFDRWGIPFIYAADDGDLFFTLGYLTARDRMFQIDYLRRKATGRLAEVLGQDAISSDVTYRTLGLAQIAEAEWQSLPKEPRDLLQAYSDGINTWVGATPILPVEFDLLNYRPESWRPQDSLAILGEFRWYLTGRLQVIATSQVLKRALGDGPLNRAAHVGEADDESILQPGDYPPTSSSISNALLAEEGIGMPGSNNWVLSAERSTTGMPLMCGDPHLLFSAIPIFSEARLKGGSFNVAGVMLAGIPGMMIGRTPQIAWTITNNICSQRDLYQEQIRPGETPSYLYDGQWERATQRREIINVKDDKPIEKIVYHSHNGPIVNELLPDAVENSGPVSLRWVGQQPCGWFTSLLDMNRAKSVSEFCEAPRPWHCPTWNLLCADTDGHIGLQTVGRIPRRPHVERGYREGWNPQHQWDGLTAFEALPRLVDPPRGYIVTANNRFAPDDYPIALSSTASSGHRARRMRQEIERRSTWSPEDCQQLQQDVVSLRAAECVPPLLKELRDNHEFLHNTPHYQQAFGYLADWDYRVLVDSVAASVFNVFFVQWALQVAEERVTPVSAASMVTARLGGLASALLIEDAHGWFHHRSRTETIIAAFAAAVDELKQRLGNNVDEWQWGRLHKLSQRHFLSGRGDLWQLFDQHETPLGGDGTTVCSAVPTASMEPYLGGVYRSIVDLADARGGMWVINSASASAQVGSPHYLDQFEMWRQGEYRYLSLRADEAASAAVSTLHLDPVAEGS